MHIMEAISKPFHRTSVLVSPEFYKSCKEYHIQFSEALRRGISLMLAEKGIKEYDNDLNVFRKLSECRTRLEETSQKYYELLDKKSE